MLVATLAIAAQATSFSFSGGDDSALASAIAAYSKKPVFILASPRRKWAATAFQVKKYDNAKRLLAARVGLSMPEDSSWGFSGITYPKDFFVKQWSNFYVDGFKTEKPVNLDERPGFFSLRTSPGSVYTLEDIALLKLKKPLRRHWFFDNARLAADIQGASEPEMLRALASALGAKFTESKESYLLDFDPRVLRGRLRFFASEATSASERADAVYLYQIVSSLSDKQLSSLYSSPSGRIEFRVPWLGPVHRAALERFRVTYEEPETPLSESRMTTYRYLIENIDFSMPISAELRADGVVSAIFFGVKPKQFIVM